MLAVADFIVVQLDTNQQCELALAEDLSPRDILENSSTVLMRSTAETPVLLKMHANDADALRGAEAGIARACMLSSGCSACCADSLRRAVVRRNEGTRLSEVSLRQRREHTRRSGSRHLTMRIPTSLSRLHCVSCAVACLCGLDRRLPLLGASVAVL